MSNQPKFPEVKAKLSDTDGNAVAIVSTVRSALRRAGHREAADTYFDEALSGDYDHVLQTSMAYVEVS